MKFGLMILKENLEVAKGSLSFEDSKQYVTMQGGDLLSLKTR